MKPDQQFIFVALALIFMTSCANTPPKTTKMTNPLAHFEIPVTDMDRAVRFYSAVFGYDFENSPS